MTTVTHESLLGLTQTDETARACMADMSAHLRSILAMEGLADFPATQALPAPFFAEYDAALAAYDRYIDHVLRGESLAVTCRAGCAACCRHELARGLTALETLAIYHLVRPWPDIGTLYEAAGENAVVFQRLLAAELAKGGGPLAAEDPRIVTAHLAYNRLERPCPFLDGAAGVCRIYPVRPLVCRWFFNLSPAPWCEPSHANYLERQAVGINPYHEVNTLMQAISERLGLRTLNYLAGAFAHLAGEVLGGAPIRRRT